MKLDQYLFEALRSKAFIHGLGIKLLASLGTLWLFLEPLGLLLPDDIPTGWKVYFTLIGIAFGLSVLLAWPKRSVSATIPGADVKVTIKVGDIFLAEGNVVIGTNDVFDTHIGDGIISNRSVQAKFVQKRFKGSVSDLDRLIDLQTEMLEFTQDETKTKGKNKRYPIGTVIEIPGEEARYYLSAYCKMGSNLKAETDVCSLLNSLEKCWGCVRNSGENLGVSMPVLASDFGRIGLTQTQLIQIIVLSFVGANRVQHLSPELTIYVYEGNAGLVDFSALQLWLRGVLWA